MKIRLLMLTVILLGLIFMAFPVSADSPTPTPTPTPGTQPSSPPSLSNVHINRNLYESGDALFYGLYDIPYAVPLAASADVTFAFKLLSPDGLTELGYNNPFVYKNNGYGQGIMALYFPASANIVWNTAYILRIAESPSQFSPAMNTDTTLGSGDYSTLTTQSDNQAELATSLYDIGSTLSSVFGVTLFGSDGKTTDDGDYYLRGAIPGIQGLAPGILVLQQVSTTTDNTTYSTTQFDTYAHRFDNTWVGTAMAATGDQFGMGGSMVMGFVVGIIAVGFVIFSSMKFKRAEPGYMTAAIILIWGVIMGWLPMAIFATIFQALAIYIAWLLLGSRSDNNRYLQFYTLSWFLSVVISLILEGVSWSNHGAGTVISNLSLFTGYAVPIVNWTIPVFNPNFISGIIGILTWNFSFYEGQFQLIRWFWMIALLPGLVWGLVTTFIWLWGTLASLLRPSISA